MSKSVYRSITAKRRTARPKAKPLAQFQGLVGKLDRAAAALSAARGRR